jgi:hypothetical protein
MAQEDDLLTPLEEAVAGFPDESGDTEDIPEEAEEAPLEAADDETEDDGFDELEIGSSKHKVPKEVKQAWANLQGATQKEKENLKVQANEQNMAMELVSAFLGDFAKIQNIDTQLEDYEKLTTQDWMSWAEQDEDAAKKAQVGVTALRMERDKLVKSVESAQRNREAKSREQNEQRVESAERELKTQIKNWSSEKRDKLQSVAKESGFSQEEVGPLVHDVRVMKILDEVREYREIKAKVSKRSSKKSEDPIPQPTPRTRSQTSSGSLRDTQDIKSWAAQFDKERARHTGRG